MCSPNFHSIKRVESRPGYYYLPFKSVKSNGRASDNENTERHTNYRAMSLVTLTLKEENTIWGSTSEYGGGIWNKISETNKSTKILFFTVQSFSHSTFRFYIKCHISAYGIACVIFYFPFFQLYFIQGQNLIVYQNTIYICDVCVVKEKRFKHIYIRKGYEFAVGVQIWLNSNQRNERTNKHQE